MHQTFQSRSNYELNGYKLKNMSLEHYHLMVLRALFEDVFSSAAFRHFDTAQWNLRTMTECDAERCNEFILLLINGY